MSKLQIASRYFRISFYSHIQINTVTLKVLQKMPHYLTRYCVTPQACKNLHFREQWNNDAALFLDKSSSKIRVKFKHGFLLQVISECICEIIRFVIQNLGILNKIGYWSEVPQSTIASSHLGNVTYIYCTFHLIFFIQNYGCTKIILLILERYFIASGKEHFRFTKFEKYEFSKRFFIDKK